MDDYYTSTDDHQSVHLDCTYPDVPRDLNHWLPLGKWFLAIPHIIILALLNLPLVVSVIIGWVAILVTGRYPKGMFVFVEGFFRWNNRVVGYALTLTGGVVFRVALAVDEFADGVVDNLVGFTLIGVTTK